MHFQDFVETILNMRGNNDAKVKDVKGLVRVMKSLIQKCVGELGGTIKTDMQTLRNDIWELKAATREKDVEEDSEGEEDHEGDTVHPMRDEAEPVRKSTSGEVQKTLSSTLTESLQ